MRHFSGGAAKDLGKWRGRMSYRGVSTALAALSLAFIVVANYSVDANPSNINWETGFCRMARGAPTFFNCSWS